MRADKSWLNTYPKDIPHEIDLSENLTLIDVFEESFKKNASRTAFESFGKSLRFKELDEASEQFASFLQFQGVKKGDRVALMMPNVMQYPIAIAGTLRCGAIVVNVNPLYTPRELEHQLKDSGAQTIVILENFVHVLSAVLSQVPMQNIVVTTMGELLGIKGMIIDFIVKYVKKLVPTWNLPHYTTFNAALEVGKQMGFTQPVIRHDDIAFLQYTGGTTGVSKGAVLEHRNLVANILQLEAWLKPTIQRKQIEQITFICALPLYHIFALTACGLFIIRSGGKSILIANPKDILGLIKTLSKLSEFHIFPAVNTLFNALMNHPHFSTIDFSSLAVTIGGGMAIQKTVADRWQAHTGCPITEGYGLSETSPVATCNLTTITEFTGHVGLPLPNTEVSIRNNLGEEVDVNQPGEICIKGPQVMRQYWHRDDETQLVMTADGFFKSGDIGFINDAGYVKIIDRKKDMILVSGFNVYPNEVEEVLSQIPGVLESAVIGINDEHSGSSVKAFIVKRDPTLSEKQVIDFCESNLTNYKRPKTIQFVETLPKSNVGKILRKDLR
ncbi:long-chain-fatty-acid--CoA ligase [Polynucleobacter sp. SHI8]|uniref:long-chain-fatty-acid--CoA ligase n=1 Tax=unclassified Polynucleobacter TaxID=2640945 RepID=UPI002491E993|nr:MULTISPECIES: long-chain-fatty-acid--CoA ligase [unclassified Polynucleobacter]BDW11552.1 long-chain-fatty-acid--CoA ligase [Polynucleobacter sp. SHI2]BDW13999.1 long-chain-fatty-acid--CoA ligase [Polynucleobacter sp. SHI8]